MFKVLTPSRKCIKFCSSAFLLGPPSNITKSNQIRVKLDFVGVKYLEEFKEKSSQKFQEIAAEIEQEVILLIRFILSQVRNKQKTQSKYNLLQKKP